MGERKAFGVALGMTRWRDTIYYEVRIVIGYRIHAAHMSVYERRNVARRGVGIVSSYGSQPGALDWPLIRRCGKLIPLR